MSEKLFSSKQDEIKIFSLFILTRLSSGEQNFLNLAENFRQKHNYKKDRYYNETTAKLFKGMIDEWWISVDGSEQSGFVAITFKGQTVLRHTSEMDEFYIRQFGNRTRIVQTPNPRTKTKKARRLKVLNQKTSNWHAKVPCQPTRPFSEIIWYHCSQTSFYL